MRFKKRAKQKKTARTQKKAKAKKIERKKQKNQWKRDDRFGNSCYKPSRARSVPFPPYHLFPLVFPFYFFSALVISSVCDGFSTLI
jgi:hypothetical protein